MPIYLNDNNIEGDVTAQGHMKWIEVNSFNWGSSRAISSPTGGSFSPRFDAGAKTRPLRTKMAARTRSQTTSGRPGLSEHGCLRLQSGEGYVAVFIPYARLLYHFDLKRACVYGADERRAT
jgi:hypothetical protein